MPRPRASSSPQRPGDAGASSTTARPCDRAGLLLDVPLEPVESRCAWGQDHCQAGVPISVRNCTGAPSEPLRLEVSQPAGTATRSYEFSLLPLAPGVSATVHATLGDGDWEARLFDAPAPPPDPDADAGAGAPRATGAITVRETLALEPGTGPEMGTAAPMLLVEAAPDGRWAVVCEARRDTNHDGALGVNSGMHGDTYGDALEPYFLSGAGPGEPLEEYLGSDPAAGRYLAVRKNRRLLLRDTVAGTDTALVAGAPPPPRQRVSFDAAGRRMVYLRARAPGVVVVVARELASGTEAEIDPSPARLDSAWIDGAGAFVVLRVVPLDTNHNGRLDLPAVYTDLAPRRCRGPVLSSSTFGAAGDAPELRVVPTTGGVPAPVPGLLRPLGDALLIRAPDGSLATTRPGAAPTTLVPASCGAQVLDGHAPTGQVLVACRARGAAGAAPLEMYGPAGRRDLRTTVDTTGVAREDELEWPRYPRPGLSWLYGARGAHATVLFDWSSGAAYPVAGHAEVRWVDQRHALLQTARTLLFFDAAGAASRALASDVEDPSFAYGVGPVVWTGWHDPLVIDAAAGRVLGRVHGEVLAVATDGRALVPARSQVLRGQLARGPVRWCAPSAPSDRRE